MLWVRFGNDDNRYQRAVFYFLKDWDHIYNLFVCYFCYIFRHFVRILFLFFFFAFLHGSYPANLCAWNRVATSFVTILNCLRWTLEDGTWCNTQCVWRIHQKEETALLCAARARARARPHKAEKDVAHTSGRGINWHHLPHAKLI